MQSYFRSEPDGLVPEPWAHAPWGTDMMHGRLIGGLAARALEAKLGADGWRAGRLTVDLFRPAAMEAIQVEVVPVRDGRKIRVADAIVTCAGHQVARVTGLFLVEGDHPPGNIWQPERNSWPDPDTVADLEPRVGADGTAWIFRPVDGSMDSAQRMRVWTNDTISLVDDEVMSPLVRAAVSGDIACPMANSGDDGVHYINADYTMLIARYPVGPWVGVEVSDHMAADGIAVGAATLVDRDGPFATSSGASIARPPLRRD
jgi:hypothetical protein